MPPQPFSYKQLIGPFVALVVLAGFIYLGVRSSEQPTTITPDTVDVTALAWPSEQIKSETITESGKGYEISAVYPVSKGESITRIFHDFVVESIDAFRADTTPSPEQGELPEGLTMTLDISYKEERHDTLDTYIFIIYSDTGGAHGLQSTKTFSFDSTGKQITVADLFTNGAKGLGVVADYVQKELMKREFADANWIKDGAAPTPENYANFFVDERGVTFMFDPYQVAPYAAGPQQVLVPVTVFQSVANQEIF